MPLAVDALTGYLLATVVGMGSPSGTPSSTTVDGNGRSVFLGENPSGSTFIAQTDNDGNLYVTTA